METVLVVDDQRFMRQLIGDALTRRGYRVTEAANGREGLAAVRRGPVDLVITDVRMPVACGFELLRSLREPDDPPVIMLSGYGDVATAVRALHEGAVDFLTVPLDLEGLARSVAQRCRPRRELAARLIGGSRAMQRVRARIGQAARSNLTVLITGESGTGKELAARLIHEQSPRAAERFVAVNCSALPETLLQSELFGHERGAFTGAHARRPGRFEIAQRGTIFLDEVGDASLATQATLLRVLEQREFERVGGFQTVPVDVRVVAATNHDLGAAVVESRFRKDLLYRLEVLPIAMPPLRERREDVPELAEAFLHEACQRDDVGFEGDALALLQEQPWPGNVRQLASAVRRLAVLAPGRRRFDADLVSRELAGPPRVLAPAQAPVADGPRAREAFHERERQQLVACLDEVRWNVSAAARSLGISRSALRYRMEKHGLA